MKVYDFLEITTNDKIDECMEFTTYMLENYGITDLREFYNEPFTPESIINYFKGWKINEQKYHTEYKNNNFIIVFNKAKKHYFLNHNNLDTELEKFVYPLVLNDFIRDCIKCNIELEM